MSHSFAPTKSFLAIFGAFGTLTGAAEPAFANNSADVMAPVRAAQLEKAGSHSDDQFRELFDNWVGSEQVASRPTQRVSIPSLIPIAGARLTSGYGMRQHPILGKRRAHAGIDLSQPIGTPIYAAADATVSRAALSGGYGLLVKLDHGGNLETRYGHMSQINVALGQVVKKGDIIGYVGSTGRSTGPHLHYEVRIAGVAVNPRPFLLEQASERADAPADVRLATNASSQSDTDQGS